MTLEEWKEKDNIQVNETYINIVACMLTYRKNNNITQKQLADVLRTTQQAVSRLENMQINPSLDFVVNMLDKLGYKLEIVKK